MRSDMARVVTEAPRRGSGARSVKTRRRLSAKEIDALCDSLGGPDDTLDVREWRFGATGGGQSGKNEGEYDGPDVHLTRAKESRHGQYGWEAKSFSDLLGPLRRYLRKQVGRRWDDIYSELSQTLDKRSLTGIHIWDHIRQEVDIHTYMTVHGTVFARSRFGGVYPAGQLYVHPYTHRLCYNYNHRYRYGGWVSSLTPQQPKPPAPIELDDVTKLVNVEGIWYECRYGYVDVYVPEVVSKYDGHVIRAGYFKSDKRQVGPRRQLSKKELRARKLQNENRIFRTPKHLKSGKPLDSTPEVMR